MAGAGGASWPGAQTVVEVPRAGENLVGFALFSKRRDCVNVVSLSHPLPSFPLQRATFNMDLMHPEET